MSEVPAHALAADVLTAEADCLRAAAERLDGGAYAAATEIVLRCAGKVHLIGAGTSGIIARKIAATLTSTGTPSLFLHPADALHGGLGVVQTGDVVIAVSNSGETGELLVILPYLRKRNVALISILGNLRSTLANESDAVLDAAVGAEAGPLGLAPTSSSTLALAVGDALAMAVLAAKGFSAENFALNHPSGRLGRRLTLRIEDVVPGGLPRPAVGPDVPLLAAIEKITEGGVGAVAVVDPRGSLVGIVTDGDVRRTLQSGLIDLGSARVSGVMTAGPVTIEQGTLAYDALQRMEDRPSQISVLPVVSPGTDRYEGLVRIHDLIRAGI